MSLAFLSCPSSWDENREVTVPRPVRPIVNVDDDVPMRAVTAADVLAALSGGVASEPNKPVLLATIMGRISALNGIHATENAVRRLLDKLAGDGAVDQRRRRTPAGHNGGVEFCVTTKPRVPLDVEDLKRSLLAVLSREPRTPNRLRGIALLRGYTMPNIDVVRARLNDLVDAGKAHRIEVDGPDKLYTLPLPVVVPRAPRKTKAPKPRKPMKPRIEKRDVTANPAALREVILSVLTDKGMVAAKVLSKVSTHAVGGPKDTTGIVVHLKVLVAQGLVVTEQGYNFSRLFKLAPSTGGTQ